MTDFEDEAIRILVYILVLLVVIATCELIIVTR